MNIVNSVKILYQIDRQWIELGLYELHRMIPSASPKTVTYVPKRGVAVPSVDDLTKDDLFKVVPGLKDFCERGFYGKEILQLVPEISVTVNY